MMIGEYIQVYDVLDEEDDLEKLRNMAKYLLVGRALNDRNVSDRDWETMLITPLRVC